MLRHPSKCPVQHLYPFLDLEDFVSAPFVLVYLGKGCNVKKLRTSKDVHWINGIERFTQEIVIFY